MKQLLFSAALLCAGIDAMRTNALLQQNFDSIFGDTKPAESTEDQLENKDGASSAYVVDSLGNLYATADHQEYAPSDYYNSVDNINLAYAAPSV